MELFETIQCPRCMQEKLIISKNLISNNLYLYCCECFAAWPSPDDVKNPEKMFMDTSDEAADPSYQDVKDAGWDKYVSNVIDV
ncbi:hypothetical protein D3C72_1838340 [compost metagenome]